MRVSSFTLTCEYSMKIKGVDLGKPYIETIVIPRGVGCIAFQAQAVLDYTDFFALCPVPEAPKAVRRDKTTGAMIDYRDVEDVKYKAAIMAWSVKKVSWMVIKSLEATPELEWDTIRLGEPDTWTNYEKELKDANFSASEIDRIIDGVTTACGLNEAKIKEATASFLAGRAEQDSVKSTLSSEQVTTQSGVPASV